MARIGFVFAAALALALSAQGADPIKLWPGKAPGETKDVGPERYLEAKKGQAEVKRLTDVGAPDITIYSPPKDKNCGTAVVVAPGGGYNILAIEHEGSDVCEFLSKLGVTAVLLKYRVPRREKQMPENLAMVQDAQRAITLVRSKSAELGVDPQRVGMLGFSAGGNLTAWTALTRKRMYDAVDKADEVSHLPSFALLIYPAYLNDKEGNLKPEFEVTKDSPPMFLVHSTDDASVPSDGSVALYMALKKNKVPAELHIYATGGHGYGMRKSPQAYASWPDRAADWLKTRGLLDKAK